MGGELVILLLLVGASVGAIGAGLVLRLYRGKGWKRALLASGVFTAALVAPTAFLFAMGTYAKTSSPQPQLPPQLTSTK